MKTLFELKADKNKALSTLGYGIMWFFIAILTGFLPFFTVNGHNIYYLTGGLALIISLFKLVRGIKSIKKHL